MLLLGHFVADYLMQNDWMGRRKWKPGWYNAGVCVMHCMIYTITVGIFIWRIDWYHLVIIFLSHFPIDRWGLAKRLMIARGDDVNGVIASGDPLQISFKTFVYIVIDNGLHLLILWFVFGVMAL